jgi:hypothetical protein
MQARVPSRIEHTIARLGYDGRLYTPLASTRGRFSWQALAGGGGICEPKRSLAEGRFSRSGERGKIISPSSSSSSSSSCPEDSDSEEVAPHALAAA